MEGRYADSEALSQRALTLGSEGGDPNAAAAHLIGAVLGHDDDAETRLRSAARMCERWRSKPWLARSRAELAVVLDRRGTATSRRDANSLRASAAALVREIGASGIRVDTRVESGHD